MFCFHKWKLISHTRLQCEKCGDVKKIPCEHNWIHVSDRVGVIDNKVKGRIYKCSHCKNMKIEDGLQ